MIARAALSLAGRVAALATLACLASATCGGEVAHDDAPRAETTPEAERVPCPVPDPAPVGPPCDGPADCADDAYCDFADNLCGQGDRGMCVTLSGGCELERLQVCACGGKIISNECIAASQGADLSLLGDCPVEAGSFRCGWRICRTASEYCRLTDGASPWSADCRSLPDACDASSTDCGCLSQEACGSACEGTLSDGLTLTCACE